MKKILSLILAMCLVFALASVAGAQTLALNHVGATDHPYQDGSLKLAELVAEYTGGELTIDVFPASQIASGAKAIEMVQTWTLDIAVESTMSLSNFVPEVGVLDLPFLFSTKEEAFKVLDGPVGDKLEAACEAQGFKILGWWDNGFRSIVSTKGIVDEPADLKGLKIRTPESQVFLTTFETLGAVPTAMAVSEVFSSMQLGTVDATENSDSNCIKNKYTDICPYYSATKHIYTAEPVIMNLDTWNMLDASVQEALQKACDEATAYQREKSLALDEVNMQTVRDLGVELFILEDASAFQAACEPVYAAFPQYAEIIEMIKAELQ
ncbi:MAG: TRAP transporter substrate-binding protein [Clostridia bacterium]|nr:TRAP transporter substrate-binding protein [Clostridia bacterium]MBQ4265107.1 TRAP transporter substrate-binding protein [Clostridia bacterium]MBQ6859483.1 TRAP transporter substrate-binding protein [Clostridia bacterium]